MRLYKIGFCMKFKIIFVKACKKIMNFKPCFSIPRVEKILENCENKLLQEIWDVFSTKYICIITLPRNIREGGEPTVNKPSRLFPYIGLRLEYFKGRRMFSRLNIFTKKNE